MYYLVPIQISTNVKAYQSLHFRLIKYVEIEVNIMKIFINIMAYS